MYKSIHYRTCKIVHLNKWLRVHLEQISRLHYDTVCIHATVSKHTCEIQGFQTFFDRGFLSLHFFTNLTEPSRDTLHHPPVKTAVLMQQCKPLIRLQTHQFSKYNHAVPWVVMPSYLLWQPDSGQRVREQGRCLYVTFLSKNSESHGRARIFENSLSPQVLMWS